MPKKAYFSLMKKLIAIFATLCGLVAAAQAQDTSPPTIDVQSPVNGVDSTTDRVTVSGIATDDVGVREVQYRLQGSRRWRKAILTERDGTSTTFVFSFRQPRKGKATRFYTRALDRNKNESPTIGMKVRRSRSNS